MEEVAFIMNRFEAE